LRAVLDLGFTFSFLPECCSGELLPSSLAALWHQRLRWAMGWDQVTLRHTQRFLTAHLPLRRKLGLYYIFVFRWLNLLLVAFVAIFNTAASFRDAVERFLGMPLQTLHVPRCIHCVQLCSGGLYVVLVVVTLVRAVLHQPGWRLPCSVLGYFMVLPFYIIFNSMLLTVSLMRLASGNLGSWVVTSRYQTASETCLEAQNKEPLLRRLSRPQLPLSRMLMGAAFLTQGALVGSIFGYLCGQHTVTHPVWGGLPFGLEATTVKYTDGTVVVKGLIVGLATSAGMILAAYALAPFLERHRHIFS